MTAERIQPPVDARPVVSVVIPTYNRAHLVGRAIQSVLRQTYSDFELIVVDDGSTDNTVEVVEAYQDPRIRLIRLARNYGVSRARNEGIQAARGEWVAFLDNDDEWLPRKLELQMARFRETDDPRITVVYGRGYRRYGESAELKLPPPRVFFEGDVFDHLLGSWSPGASGFVVRRSSLLGVGGFDEELAGSEDWDLWLRLAKAGHHFAAVRELVGVKYEHAGQLSTDPVARRRDFAILDRKWGRIMERGLGAAGYQRWRAARYANIQYAQFMRVREAMARGDRIAAWRYCVAMCRFLPWSRKYMIHGLALATLGRGAYGALARARETLLHREEGR